MCIRDRGSTIRISYLGEDSFRHHHTSISLWNMEVKLNFAGLTTEIVHKGASLSSIVRPDVDNSANESEPQD